MNFSTFKITDTTVTGRGENDEGDVFVIKGTNHNGEIKFTKSYVEVDDDDDDDDGEE